MFFLNLLIEVMVSLWLGSKVIFSAISNSCDGRVVKALDSKSVGILKSNGIFPRRFKSYSQRYFNQKRDNSKHTWYFLSLSLIFLTIFCKKTTLKPVNFCFLLTNTTTTYSIQTDNKFHFMMWCVIWRLLCNFPTLEV